MLWCSWCGGNFSNNAKSRNLPPQENFQAYMNLHLFINFIKCCMLVILNIMYMYLCFVDLATTEGPEPAPQSTYEFSSMAATSVLQGQPPPPGTDLEFLLTAPPPPPPPEEPQAGRKMYFIYIFMLGFEGTLYYALIVLLWVS